MRSSLVLGCDWSQRGTPDAATNMSQIGHFGAFSVSCENLQNWKHSVDVIGCRVQSRPFSYGCQKPSQTILHKHLVRSRICPPLIEHLTVSLSFVGACLNNQALQYDTPASRPSRLHSSCLRRVLNSICLRLLHLFLPLRQRSVYVFLHSGIDIRFVCG